MKHTQEDLRIAKEALSRQIGSKTGISYVGIGRGELRVGYKPEHCSIAIPGEVNGVPVRLVRTGDVVARDVMRTLR